MTTTVRNEIVQHRRHTLRRWLRRREEEGPYQQHLHTVPSLRTTIRVVKGLVMGIAECARDILREAPRSAAGTMKLTSGALLHGKEAAVEIAVRLLGIGDP